MPKPLVLVQLSDPHFHAEVRPRFWGKIAGYRGHDYELTCALPLALDRVPSDLGLDPDLVPRVLVTGDLSVAGTSGEFRTARSYFVESCVRDPEDGLEWGLGLTDPEPRRVPGNHDHWDGRMLGHDWQSAFQRAFNPAIFPEHFEPHPWGPIELEGDGFLLELAGLDTLSGFTAQTTNVLARGAVDLEQVRELTRRLRRSRMGRRKGERVLRCLLLHHPTWTQPRLDMQLDRASRKLLCELAKRERIQVALVGHEHRFGVRQPGRALLDGLRREFWEVRAPSVFQGPARDRCHGFLVHVLRRDHEHGHAVSWTVHPYFWSVLDHRFLHDARDAESFQCEL